MYQQQYNETRFKINGCTIHYENGPTVYELNFTHLSGERGSGGTPSILKLFVSKKKKKKKSMPFHLYLYAKEEYVERSIIHAT